jgi:hypothetical protein
MTLDAAWAEATALLPEGWTLQLGDWHAEPDRPDGMPPFEAIAEPYSFREQQRQGSVVARGDTPVAALQRMTASLREVRVAA